MSNPENPRQWKTDPDLWEKLKPLARQHRHEPTATEDRLWHRLRNRKLHGFKFRRQHTINRFIVDFFCADADLIVELDGAVHQYTGDEDAIRQAYLESLGLRVLRFTNDDVWERLEGVLVVIERALGVEDGE